MGSIRKIGSALIHPHTQVGPSPRASKFDKDIAHVPDTLLKLFEGGFGAAGNLVAVGAIPAALADQVL